MVSLKQNFRSSASKVSRKVIAPLLGAHITQAIISQKFENIWLYLGNVAVYNFIHQSINKIYRIEDWKYTLI